MILETKIGDDSTPKRGRLDAPGPSAGLDRGAAMRPSEIAAGPRGRLTSWSIQTEPSSWTKLRVRAFSSVLVFWEPTRQDVRVAAPPLRACNSMAGPSCGRLKPRSATCSGVARPVPSESRCGIFRHPRVFQCPRAPSGKVCLFSYCFRAAAYSPTRTNVRVVSRPFCTQNSTGAVGRLENVSRGIICTCTLAIRHSRDRVYSGVAFRRRARSKNTVRTKHYTLLPMWCYYCCSSTHTRQRLSTERPPLHMHSLSTTGMSFMESGHMRAATQVVSI